MSCSIEWFDLAKGKSILVKLEVAVVWVCLRALPMNLAAQATQKHAFNISVER